jgi:outer membrane protein OmpA-like peptidoglycan-associated protein
MGGGGNVAVHEKHETITVNPGGNVQVKQYGTPEIIQNLGVREYQGNYFVDLGSDILFESGKAEISPRAADKLAQLAQLIQRENRGYVVFRGHTDSVGSDYANQALSERRARAVAAWVQHYGVSPQYIMAEGYGEAYPVANNSNSSGKALNRRVEVIIQRNPGIAVPAAGTYLRSNNGQGAIVAASNGNITAVGSHNNAVQIDAGGLSGVSSRGNTIDMNSGGFNVKSRSGKSINIFGN